MSKLKNFTPLIDSMTERLGLIPSAIFGRVWRYAKRTGKCYAAQSKIANTLGLSRATVNRHLQLLVDEGYLSIVEPVIANRPNTYALTGKADVLIYAEAYDKGAIVNQIDTSDAQIDTDCQPELREDTNKKEVKENTPNGVPTGKRQSVTYLMRKYADAMGTTPPNWGVLSEKDRRMYGKRWSSPLGRMWTRAERDTLRAEKLMLATIKEMRRNGLTISAPQSLENMFEVQLQQQPAPRAPQIPAAEIAASLEE